MRIAGEPARPPRATSRSERRPRRTGAEHSARQPVDDDGSERPGSISAPAQITVDERRTRRRYGGACARLTDRPTNQACRGGGIGTPPRLRKRRDGDPRAPTFRTAVVSVVPAADSPGSGAPWHADHRTLHGSGQPTGVAPLAAGAGGSRAGAYRRLGAVATGPLIDRMPACPPSRPLGLPAVGFLGTPRLGTTHYHRDRRRKPAAILRVGRPHAPCRSFGIPARPPSVHTVAMAGAGPHQRIDSTLGGWYE